jgi:hypothetical protein
VDGLYQLEVTVFGYNNPTGRCQGCGDLQGCCDGFGSTNCASIQFNLCDSYFNYCLRTIGSTERGCSYFGNQRSNSNTGDAPLDFSQNMVLGLENPITLQGLTDTYTVISFKIYLSVLTFSSMLHFQGVQLHIEITDDDLPFSSDDLVDVLLIDHDLPVGQPSPRKNYTGIYDINFVTMDLSIMAKCVENNFKFQGPDCSQCSPGFTGTMCTININDCIGVNCSGNGQCVDGVLSYTCDCDSGFTGVECDVNIDDCVTVNCSGNGQCVDGIHSYTCKCDPGFTGMECGISIDDCVGVNCSGNGQCVDEISSFSCNCNASFIGPLCETHTSDSEGERLSATLIGGILGAILSFALLALLFVLVVSVVMHKLRGSKLLD